jgi:hypothetical protein
MLSQKHPQIDPTKIIAAPQSERGPDGLRMVRFHFGGFEALMKTDARPWHPDVEPFTLKENPPWRIFEDAYENGMAHWLAMNRIFKSRRSRHL